MERFHWLIDRELAGLLTAGEAAELTQLRQQIDVESAPRIEQMQEKIARQDRLFHEAMAAYRSSRPAATKSANSHRK